MTYDLQTFASVPLCMEPTAVRGWIARQAGQPKVSRSEWMSRHQPQGQEVKADWMDDYLAKALAHLAVSYDEKEGIASFQVTGVMWQGADMWDELWGLYNTARIAKNMEEISRRADMKAVVITINTPGGTARGTLEAAQAIAAYREKSKVPVAAWIPDLGCSAGYYVASACDTIAAHPAAMVGSIGTMAVAVDSSRFWEKMGLDITLYTGGADLKGMGSQGVKWTDAWHQKLEEGVEEYRSEFINFVKSNRSWIKEDSFRGDAFEARRAPVGMVDQVTTL